MKGFYFKVFLGCDDHTLSLRLVGRLEQGQCLAPGLVGRGKPTPCALGRKPTGKEFGFSDLRNALLVISVSYLTSLTFRLLICKGHMHLRVNARIE